MALVIADRVRETSTTTGTGTLTLAGAVSGFQTFSTAIGNTNTCYYTIVNGSEWEVGLGTVAAGTLARTTVLKSSNAGSAVDFSAGTKDVFGTYPADKSVLASSAKTLGGIGYGDGTGLAFTSAGTSGQVLQSNGTSVPTWATLDALPSQTGNAGKYLSTDGTSASWQNTGASAAGVIWENSLIISTNYTLTTSKNGLSVGPITINSGVSVTVPSGQRWVVL